jgi:hypothetical protein
VFRVLAKKPLCLVQRRKTGYRTQDGSFFITITLLPVELRVRLLTGQPAQGIKSVFERERNIDNPNAGCRRNLLRQMAQ